MKSIIAWGVFIVIGMVAYGGVSGWHDERAKERKARFDRCVIEAEINYQTGWNNNCEKLNKMTNGFFPSRNCLLPVEVANGHDRDLRFQKDLCLKMQRMDLN